MNGRLAMSFEIAAKSNEIRKIQKLAERRYAKRDDQKTQRPFAGRELDELNRIRAESVMESTPQERA